MTCLLEPNIHKPGPFFSTPFKPRISNAEPLRNSSSYYYLLLLIICIMHFIFAKISKCYRLKTRKGEKIMSTKKENRKE